LPVYTVEQTDSTYPGYRRSTATSRTTVYVNDFEESALLLANTDPTNARTAVAPYRRLFSRRLSLSLQ
jgi:fumarylacetoacetate (FAA) hydrolase family protein